MNDDQRQDIIRRLQQGEELSTEWARILFPPEKREYELVYHGKEREEEVIANTLAVPLQKVRTFGRNGTDWDNKLIFGDNLQVMKTLLELKRAGKLRNADGTSGVRLVYIDPPFASRREFEGSQDQKAYGDKLVGARFVEFMRKRMILIRELLADDGSVYVHLDEKKSHYMKVILDEVFGEQRFQREIVWRIGWLSGYKTLAKNWIRNHDIILFYSKGPAFRFNKQYIPYPEDYVRRDGSPPTGEGYPIEDTWNSYSVDQLDSIQIKSFSQEKVGYPTQKNEELAARIIRSSSDKGDIVLDAFAGSGTTLSVAEKLGRRWVGIDCGKLAIYTIQKRMLNLRKEIGNKGAGITPKPFSLYNAGLYDFSKLKELAWDAWRFFALQLFQCRDEPHRIGGIQLDGYLKGSSVLVFNHQKRPGVRMDEETIQSIHEALGSKIGNRLFIVAPALVFDFQQDYLTIDGVRYYALRIPYSIIHELHQREFTALKQPADEMDVNNTVDAVGFDFIRPPELEYSTAANKRRGEEVKEGVIHIKKFKSDAVVRDSTKSANFETFSMVMVDFDFDTDSDVFDLDTVFYRETIEKAGWEVRFPLESIGKHVMAVFVDIYGNEARELIPASRFGLGNSTAVTKSAKKVRQKANK